VTGVNVLINAEKHGATSGIVLSQVRDGRWSTIDVLE
jgi:hypothetical protein